MCYNMNIQTDFHRMEMRALGGTIFETVRKTPYGKQEFKMLKRCTQCKIDKDISCFSVGKSECKSCASIRNKIFRQSIKGLITTIYQNQKKNSKSRGHNPPQYTKQELYIWITKQPNFEMLYNEWVISGYSKNKIPSIDRIDDSIGYSFENIQLVDFYTNKNKYNKQKIKGIAYKSNNTPVIGTSTKTGENVEFHSISEAARCVSGSADGSANICKSIKNKTITAYGYKWEYKTKDSKWQKETL